jgi:hypothetical protein
MDVLACSQTSAAYAKHCTNIQHCCRASRRNLQEEKDRARKGRVSTPSRRKCVIRGEGNERQEQRRARTAKT